MGAPARLLLAVALAAALLLPSLAPATRAGPELPSLLATAYNTERKLARAADGTLYAAVVVNASGIPQVRVLATTGGAAWTTLPHPSPTDNASDRAALAIDSTGRLHLVWTENASAGERQVFYAAFPGGAWTPAVQLSFNTGYAGFPSLAVDAADRVHVVWYGFDGLFYQVFYRRLEAGAWTPGRALTNENVDATNPGIALGPGGEVNVAWFRQNRNATLNEIAYLRLVGDTIVETETISPPGVDAVDPSLVVDAGGDVHAVWSARIGTLDRIQEAVRQTDAPWAVVGFVTPPGVAAMHPSLALHRDGGKSPADLRVVWEGADGQVYAQAGPAWSAPVPLSSRGTNRYPSARWAQWDNPLCPAGVGIDVIWTHEEAGVASLGSAVLSSDTPCAQSPPNLIVVAAAGVLAAAILAVLLVQRARGRKRETEPTKAT